MISIAKNLKAYNKLLSFNNQSALNWFSNASFTSSISTPKNINLNQNFLKAFSTNSSNKDSIPKSSKPINNSIAGGAINIGQEDLLTDYYSNSKKTIVDTDIMIIGGGIVGLSAAAAFSEAKITDKIVLIDQSNDLNPIDYKYSPHRIPDIRAVSLTPGSMKFLQSIKALDVLDRRLLTFVKEMQIWENQGSNFINFKSDEVKSIIDIFRSKILSNDDIKNEKKSGINSNISNFDDVLDSSADNKFISCMVEINNLLMGLQERTKSVVNKVNHKLDLNSFDIQQTNDYTYFTIFGPNENTTYRTKLLIVSDGPKSVVRTKLDLPLTGFNYNETGLVCTLSCNTNTKTAYQRFVHDGIFALLPMYDNYYSIVCSMPTEFNEKLKSINEEEFINFVNALLHNSSEVDFSKLDRLIQVNSNNFNNPPYVTGIHSKRLSFPLQLQYLDECVHNNIVVLGDSAHQVHPMAGQGLNLGISDSALLTNLIAKNVKLGKRINDPIVLRDYARQSQTNTKTMISTMESIKLAFKPTNNIVTGIRNIGLGMMNNSEYLKGLMVDIGSGKITLPAKYEWEK